MKRTYHGYDPSTVAGQKDLFYSGRVDPNRRISADKPQATDSDKRALADRGLAALEADGAYGILDRLRNSGII